MMKFRPARPRRLCIIDVAVHERGIVQALVASCLRGADLVAAGAVRALLATCVVAPRVASCLRGALPPALVIEAYWRLRSP